MPLPKADTAFKKGANVLLTSRPHFKEMQEESRLTMVSNRYRFSKRKLKKEKKKLYTKEHFETASQNNGINIFSKSESVRELINCSTVKIIMHMWSD
jgi:hypothetical protein